MITRVVLFKYIDNMKIHITLSLIKIASEGFISLLFKCEKPFNNYRLIKKLK